MLTTNKITFRVITMSKKGWYVIYPGFCSIVPKTGEKQEPFFCTGLGVVTESLNNELPVGCKIVYAGYTDAESKQYYTSNNSVVRVDDLTDSVPEYIGCVAQMIYAVSILAPQAGMNFYVEPTLKEVDLFKNIIYRLGCNVKTDSDIYDGAFYETTLPINLPLTFGARTVRFVTFGDESDCKGLGQDFHYRKYMLDGWEVPKHYLPSNTVKNLTTALRLLGVQTNHLCNVDIAPDCTISEKSFPALMRKAFSPHINPGVMTVSVAGPDMQRALKLAKGIAKYVINSDVLTTYCVNVGNGLIETLTYANHSVVDCLAIMSSKWDIEAELHFDRTSSVFYADRYMEYSGKIAPRDKEKIKVSLSDSDIDALIFLNDKNAEAI
jgi:hypothetical protein